MGRGVDAPWSFMRIAAASGWLDKPSGRIPAGSDLAVAAVQVHLVLEGAAGAVEDLPTHPLLDVVHAPADGDSAIVDLVGKLVGGPGRVLAAAGNEVEARGASVVKFTATRYSRFVRTLSEYVGWAARLRSDFGPQAADFLARDLAGNAAVEQQHHDRGPDGQQLHDRERVGQHGVR